MKRKIQSMLSALLLAFILAGNYVNAQVDVVAGGTTTYANLKLAFDAINLGTHTGAITINITGAGTYTDPGAPAVLNSTGTGAANYTSVLIRPTADGVTIKATTVLGRGVIELNAADNVTIDGDNPNTGGTNRNLTIQNLAAATITYTSVVRVMTSATAGYTSADNNTVKNCLITGSAVGRMLSTATSTTGSENTTFGIYVGAGAGAAPTAISSVTTNTAPSGSTVNAFLVDNNAVISCARGIVFNGAAATVSTGVTITNNAVGDQTTTPSPSIPPYTSPTNTVYTKSIWVNGAGAVTITGNAIKNIMSYVATTTSGIELAGAIGTSVTISSNTINNVTINATSSAPKGILVTSATGTYTISKNTIDNTQSMGGSSGTAAIDATGTVTSATIELNRITTVYNRSTGTWGASGIIFGGTAVTVKNNTVSDVKMDMTGGAAFSTTFGVHGIRCNAGTNHKVYHNSVNLYGSLLGTAAGSILTSAFCIVGTGLTGVTVYNNIFMNRLSGGTAGTVAHVAVFVPSAATSAMNFTINNNAYYCGTDATTQGIGQAGTTASAPTYLTLAAMKVYTATLNAAGTNDNASFGNTATTFAPFTSDANFHIPAGTASFLESGGISQVTTGVTTDYDQPTPDVRPGPAGSIYGGASAPDIGADEFDGVNNLPPAITYTALGNTTSTSNRNLNGVTITDADGVNNTTFKPRIYYKKSTAPNTVAGWQSQQSTGTFDFLIDYSLIGGVSAGDIIQYFVVAQDLSGTPLVGINSGTFAATPSSVALTAAAFPITGTIRQYNIVGAPLSGDYTIGVAMLNRALGKNITMERVVKKVMKEVFVADENTDNVKSTEAPVTASVNSSKGKMVMKEVEEVSFVPMENGREYTGPLYSKRSENPGLPVDAGVGVYGTITAAVNDLNLRGISGAVRFLLLDAAYPSETYPIVINDIVGASSTNTFTLKPNTGVTSTISGASPSTAAIKVLSSYATIDGSNTVNGTTRDLTIENTSVTSPIAVWFGSTGTTTMNASGIKNCNVINGVNTSSAIVLTDGALTTVGGYFTNFTIQNNSVQKAYIGIYSFYATAAGNGNGCVYSGNSLNTSGANSVRFVGIYVQGADGALVTKNDIGNFDGTSSEDDKGVWFATGTVNSTFEKNKVHDLVYTGTGGYGGHGSYISSGVTGCNNTVANNMYANLSGDGWSYTSIPTDNPIGIVVTGTQTGVKIYYNSINMYGNTLNQTSAMSMGIYLGAGSVADIRNNSIVNNQGLLAAIGYGTSGIYAVTDNTQFSTINNNNYYVTPTGSGVKYVGQIAAAGSVDLAAWKIATAQDANSVSGNPQYVSNSDLHVSLATNSILNNNGGLGTGITDDIDAPNVRSATTPDIGADEFTGTYVVNLTIALEVCPSNNVTVALYNNSCGLIGTPQTVAYTGPGAYTVAVPFAGVTNATTCWIKVTSENSLVVWSSALSTFSASALSYNFTTGLSQVFGGINLINGGGVYRMVSGDVNQDETVDASDVAAIDNDAVNGIPGGTSTFPTDLNCDGFVDSGDQSTVDNNATFGYFSSGPCSPAGFPHKTNDKAY